LNRVTVRVGSTREFGAGLFLACIAAASWWEASDLPYGSLASPGPGLMPKTTALVLFLGAAALIVRAFRETGSLELPGWRGPFFIFGSIMIFALLIRSGGLIVATPAAIMFSAMGDENFRAKEAVTIAVVVTLGCILLFTTILNLPLPVIGTMFSIPSS
jgi:hypothetical protein